MALRSDSQQILRDAGIANPMRLVRLLEEAVQWFDLDLTGLTVLTEAASGAYVVTPILAAMAGACSVISLTRDSQYGTTEQVIAQTRALQALCSIDDKIEIHTARTAALFARADLITNLGFVRPLDAATVQLLRPNTVISLMCEAWEFRPGDVALDACRCRGIAVIGTNEDFLGMEVFVYSGWLCMKLLLEAQIELHKCKICIVSGDKFGSVIQRCLDRSGVQTYLAPSLSEVSATDLATSDALIVADYTRNDVIVGEGGDLSAAALASLAPQLTVIPFAGAVDSAALAHAGLSVYPPQNGLAHRMTVTLAGLGARPVVELHAAGLKVGEVVLRGADATQTRWTGLMQPL